jgi:hypothetical protein
MNYVWCISHIVPILAVPKHLIKLEKKPYLQVREFTDMTIAPKEGSLLSGSDGYLVHFLQL